LPEIELEVNRTEPLSARHVDSLSLSLHSHATILHGHLSII